MALPITDEHRALSAVVGEFAVEQGVRAATRRALDAPPTPGEQPDPLWKQVVAQAWTGLHVAEEYGGSGFGLLELAVVAEGLGREVGGGPFLPTVVAAGVVAECGDEEQRRRWLPGLVDGTTTASLTTTPGAAWGGVWAGLHLVRSGADIRVHTRARIETVDGFDPALGAAVVVAEDEGELLVGAAAPLDRLLRTLAAAEAAGGARAALDQALAYATVREQFGRAIGSFQAVKHHLADMLVRSELAVAAVWDAAQAGTGPDADLAAASAAVTALDAYLANARTSIQIHGGIGFTWEHDAHLYLRRATALAAFAGPVDRAADDVVALSAAGVHRDFGVALPEEADEHRGAVRRFRAAHEAGPEAKRRALLVDSGYLLPHWDRPWGRGAGPVEQLVIEEELAGLKVPSLGIGGWVLLTLVQMGTPEQVRRWIRPGLLGEQAWCQLFSEPGAGSDAAAVSTRGVRAEGGWRVMGQKVWTSNAHRCQWGLATVRTDPAAGKHEGLTAMAIDLTAPGVMIRPLREITGNSYFNEVFLDDVFVPDGDVVGEPGTGWSVARATLANERVTIGGVRQSGVVATGLPALVAAHAADDPALLREAGRLIAEASAISLLNLRVVERAVVGAAPAVEGNVSKLVAAEHAQRVTETAMRIAGVAAVTGGEARLAYQYLFRRALTIAGGTSEVSRNVIAERILGLPREAVAN